MSGKWKSLDTSMAKKRIGYKAGQYAYKSLV